MLEKGCYCSGITFSVTRTVTERTMSYTVVEIQATPNPNASKFVLDRLIAVEPASFFNAESAKDHPIASRLFLIPGVSSLLLLNDFVTVNKRPEAQWKSISGKVRDILKKVRP